MVQLFQQLVEPIGLQQHSIATISGRQKQWWLHKQESRMAPSDGFMPPVKTMLATALLINAGAQDKGIMLWAC